jgi:hypothetical protein
LKRVIRLPLCHAFSLTQLCGTLHRDANSPAVNTSNNGPRAGNSSPKGPQTISSPYPYLLALYNGVKRFKERQPEFVDDFLAKDTIEGQSREWITAWQAGQEELKKMPKKSPFRQPAPSEKKKEADTVPAGTVTAAQEDSSDQD